LSDTNGHDVSLEALELMFYKISDFNLTSFLEGELTTVNEPILGIAVACLIILFFTQSILLYRRRGLQPLKSRGPKMLFLNLLGSYGLLAFLTVFFVNMIKGNPENTWSVCIAWKWAVSLLYPMITFSFFLRYYRVRYVFSGVKRSTNYSLASLYLQAEPVRKSHMGENHILRILIVILLFLGFLSFCVWLLVGDKNIMIISDGCENGSLLTSLMICWVVVHCIELVAFLWIAVDSMRVVKRPEFSMTKEMLTIAIIWGMITAGAATLLAVQLKRPSMTGDDQWYWRWNTLCDLCYIVVYATVGTTAPLVQSYLTSSFNWYPLFGDCKVLRSLESILGNISSLQMFRTFLIKECTVENLLLWVEIEIFKDNATKRRAFRIFKKFLKDESELEVTTVSDELKKQLFNRIKNSGDRDDLSLIFEEVQEEIFTYMKRESYPRFLASAQSRLLVDILDNEEFLCQSLKDSGMI